jgi:hypothetical protein
MRQFLCIEITREDALVLREVMRPFDEHSIPESLRPYLAKFSIRLYDALIDLEKKEAVNIPVSEEECLLINQKVGNEDYGGALGLLRQTWAVLYELKNDMPPGMGFDIESLITEKIPTNDDGYAGAKV